MNEENKNTLDEIKMTLAKTTKPTEYTDTSKMSKKEMDALIKELKNKNDRLQRELSIRESINNRYIQGILQSKYDEITKLIDNPVLTLPSGKQITFNSLSPEQLEYLEGLSQQYNKLH